MSESRTTRGGMEGIRPGREAPATYSGRRRRRGEQAMVPDAEFGSYYGKPVINGPVWHAPDIPGYLFLGGLAGASSLMAAAADLLGDRQLSRAAKVGAAGAAGLSLVALVHDLGKPSRFLNMLRVLKVTSPMSVGSWLLAGYGPLAAVAAATSVAGRLPLLGGTATAGAAALGPAVASYTAALIADTAVPAWHDGHRELPYVFVSSGAMAAGGLGLLTAPVAEQALPRLVAVAGTVVEVGTSRLMEQRMGMVAEPYEQGRSGRLVKGGTVLAAGSAVAAVLGRRRRWVGRLAGLGLMTSSALTRFGIFEAGRASADDPKYTVVPQRARLERRGA